MLQQQDHCTGVTRASNILLRVILERMQLQLEKLLQNRLDLDQREARVIRSPTSESF